MYARVSTFTIQPEKLDEAIGIICDSALPALQQQPGYQGLLALADRETDRARVLTFWEGQAAMLAGERSGFFQQQRAKVARLLAMAAAPGEHYEVTAQSGPDEGAKYARVAPTQVKPGRLDEAIRLIRDQLLPAATKSPGNKGYLSLTDARLEKGFTLSLWATEADMRAGEAGSGYITEAMDQITSLVAGQFVLEYYEVAVLELA
jgi:heme-degrading monooxygenase HmoA